MAEHSHSPICLFVLINLVQAVQGLRIEYDPKVTASPGENITLKCILLGQQNSSVVQIQWSKETYNRSDNMLLANRHFGIHRFQDSVEFESPSPTKGMASISIRNVQVSASGTYTCSVVTFPEGSFKVSIILTVIKKAETTIPQIYEELKYFAPNKLHLNSTCISRKAYPEPNVTLYLDGIALQDGENGTIITSEAFVDSSGLYEVKKRLFMEIAIGQWKLIWCDAVFSLPGNINRAMQSKKIHLNNYLSTATTKQTTFSSQHTTSWKGTESYSITELTTSTGMPFAVGSSTTPATSTSIRSFTRDGLSTIFQVSQSSTTFGSSINIALSNSAGPSVTNGLSTREGQTITLQPLISIGSFKVSMKSTEIPINKTSLHTTMSWNRTSSIDSTVDEKDAEDSVSVAVVVIVILILVISTAVLSYLIRFWQVRKKLNAPPPFKPPPPPIKYTAIQVSPLGEVND